MNAQPNFGRSTDVEHERRAAVILDGMYQFVALLNPEGDILEVNRAALEGAGHRIEEIRDKPFWTARWWQVSEKIHEELKAAIGRAAAGEFVRYEVQIYGEKAGLIPITIDFSLQPIGSESGEVEYLLAEGRNISERKQAEEALRRTETELRDLIENMPAIAGVLLPDGSHPYLTKRWQEYTGLSVVETDSEGWRRVVHPEDIDLYAEKTRAAAAARKPFESELRLRRAADGEYRWFLVRISPLCDGRGNIVKWHGVMTDIEDRKRAEQALKRSEAYLAEAQELTKTGSWARDPDSGQLVYCSDETYRIFGLHKAEGIPSIETFIQRIHSDDRAMVRAQSLQGSGEETEHAFEYRILLADGTVKHVRTLRRPVFNDSGEVVEVVGTTMDITERKRAEQERERLRQLEAELAHMNRVSLMGELAASLAHEIKQPVTAAVNNAQACLRLLDLDRPDIAEAREASSAMIACARRTAEIIDHVRSLSKKDTPRRELVDVNEIIREIHVLLLGEANKQLLAMRIDLAPELPKITADRVQLQQVLMNLMLNGIESMKDSGGELIVKSELDQDGQVLISVSDNGVGLPPEKADQIFDAFFTTKPQGTGMGLAISRSIVESHGGRIWATPNSGPGATFRFTLPYQAAARA